MKILHISDLHLSSSLTSRLFGEKLRTRRAELSLVFERCIDLAEDEGASAIIIAGDLFDTEKIGARAKANILDLITRTENIDFLYLPGNHEKETLLEGARALPKNLSIFESEWTYLDYGEVSIAGRSALSKSMFSEYKHDPEKKNIAVLHGATADRSTDGIIGLKDASEVGIDYLALGHYHTYSATKLENGGTAVYSGTPEGRGFDEVGECGAVLIDTDGEHIKHRFIPLARRLMVIKEVDISGARVRTDVDSAVRDSLTGISPSSLVRAVLVGRHLPELSIDTDAITKRYADRFFYFETRDESGIIIDPEEYKYDKSLKGEFIRLLASKDMDEATRSRIIKAGLGALIGELGDV